MSDKTRKTATKSGSRSSAKKAGSASARKPAKAESKTAARRKPPVQGAAKASVKKPASAKAPASKASPKTASAKPAARPKPQPPAEKAVQKPAKKRAPAPSVIAKPKAVAAGAEAGKKPKVSPSKPATGEKKAAVSSAKKPSPAVTKAVPSKPKAAQKRAEPISASAPPAAPAESVSVAVPAGDSAAEPTLVGGESEGAEARQSYRIQLDLDGTTLEIIEGDITEVDVEALVNPANENLQLGTGVAGAILAKGGPTIQEECDRIGHIAVGTAVMTGAGRLKAKQVIHAVGPRWGEGDEDRKLSSAVRSAMALADRNGLRSLALPAISTGNFGFPLERAARIMLTEIHRYLQGGTKLHRVVLCLYGEESFITFRRELRRGFR